MTLLSCNKSLFAVGVFAGLALLSAMLLISNDRHRHQGSIGLDVDHFLPKRQADKPVESSMTATVRIKLITNNTIDQCSQGFRSPNVLVQLEYRKFQNDASTSSPWEILEYLVVDSANTMEQFEVRFTYSGPVQFRLRQLEHGSGRCGCWSVCQFVVITQLQHAQQLIPLSTTDHWCHAFANVSSVDTGYLSHCNISASNRLSFCLGSASEARGAVSNVIELRQGQSSLNLGCGGEMFLSDKKPINFSHCAESQPHINANFKLYSPHCSNHPDAFEEGVEVSFIVFDEWNTGRGEWIPFAYFAPTLEHSRKKIKFERGNIDKTSNTTTLRGYVTPFVLLKDNQFMNYSVSICGEEYTQRGGIQFRWLQTGQQSQRSNVDVWSFDMINVVWSNGTHHYTLASGEDLTNDTVWNQDIRGGCLVANSSYPCQDGNSHECPLASNAQAVAFGIKIPPFPADINSHLLTTAELKLPLSLIPVSPMIQEPPKGAIVESFTRQEGGSISFHCLADGHPLPEISWLRNGILVDFTLQKRLSVNFNTTENSMFRPHVPQALLSTLSISNVQLGDAAEYTCQAHSSVAVVRKSIAVLAVDAVQINYCAQSMCLNNGTCTSVINGHLCECPAEWIGEGCETAVMNTTEEAAKVVIPPTVKDLPNLFASVNLTCQVSGVPQPTIQWYKDGSVMEGERLPRLEIKEVHLSDRGHYHCVTSNTISGSEMIDTSENVVLNIKGIAQYKVSLNTSEEASQVEIENLTRQLTNLRLSGNFNDTSIMDVTSKGEAMNGCVSMLVTLHSSGSKGIAVGTKLKEEVERIVTEYARSVQNGRITVDAVERFDGCPAEDTPLYEGIVLKWPETSIGTNLDIPCPCGDLLNEDSDSSLNYSRTAHRSCEGNFVRGGEWAEPEDDECNFSSSARQLCQVTTIVGDTETAVNQLEAITADEAEIMAFEVGLVSQLLVLLSDGVVREQNITVVEEFFSVIDNILKVNANQLSQSQQETQATTRILNVVNTVTSSIPIPENETEQIIPFQSFAVSVREVNPDEFRGQTFSVSLGGTITEDSRISEDSLSFGNQFTMTTASIKLPEDLFEQINATNKTDLRISHTVFLNDTLFVRENGSDDFEEESEVVGSVVMAATLSSNVTVKNLQTYVEINFTKSREAQEDHNITETCVFWDFEANDGFGDWSPEGCDVIASGDTFVVCGCNHLTHFALLLDFNPKNQTKIPTIKHIFFEAVSYIGSAISILCLLVTIATYLSSKTLRTTIHGKLLVNLCFSFLGIYIMFIVASLLAEIDSIPCAIAGALLQYFMLVTFAIMAAEAIILYINLVVVFGWNSIKNRYALKTALISWISPVVVVILCVAPDYTNYTDDDLCRPYKIPFYIGILAPFGLMYLFNWIIFLIIFTSLLKRSCTKKEVLSANDKLNTPQALLKRHFITAVCLSLLFGLGWGFGILATNEISVIPVRIIFQAFFIAFVSFQGLLIFVMQCLRSSDARNEWKRWLKIATCGKVAAFEFSQSSTQARYTPANLKRTSNSNGSSLPKVSSGNSETLQSALYSEDQSTPIIAAAVNGRASHDSVVAMAPSGAPDIDNKVDYPMDGNGSLKKDTANTHSKKPLGLSQIQIHPWYKVTAV